jgi:hypothetical protein
MRSESSLSHPLTAVRSIADSRQRSGSAGASPMCCRTPVLLGWRLTALRLNPRDIERAYPQVFANLQHTCASCSEKRRCLDDMMDSINPPGWESYCPNSGTIRTLL